MSGTTRSRAAWLHAPEPAAVTAWRQCRSCTSPAANTPGTEVEVRPGGVWMYPASSSSSWPSKKAVAGAWPGAEWGCGAGGSVVGRHGGGSPCVQHPRPLLSSSAHASPSHTNGKEEAAHGQARDLPSLAVLHHNPGCTGGRRAGRRAVAAQRGTAAGRRTLSRQLPAVQQPRPAHKPSPSVPSSRPYASWHSVLNRTSIFGCDTARRAITLDDCRGGWQVVAGCGLKGQQRTQIFWRRRPPAPHLVRSAGQPGRALVPADGSVAPTVKAWLSPDCRCH